MALGFGIGIPFIRRRGTSFTPEYQAILDRATALGYSVPSAGQQVKQNLLIQTLITSGIFADADFIRVTANDGSAQFATINWKNPNSNQATLINSPTFLANNGFQSNGSSSYVNENWSPASGVNYALNDASDFIWINNNLSGVPSAFLMGVGDSGGTNASVFEKNATTQIYPRINSSTSGFLDNAANPLIGLYGSHRSTLTNCHYSKNGVVLLNYTAISTTRTANNSFTLCRNNNGTASNFLASGYYSFRLSGKNISGTKLTDLYNAINTYITSL